LNYDVKDYEEKPIWLKPTWLYSSKNL